jgi:GntR family transcriptional repressor for pyruvate dehydrogenase complex
VNVAAPLIEASIERIRDLIVSGALRPGQRLPPEHELAALLGSSRNTTREAVRALVMARVLDVRRGDGTYVTSLSPELLLEGVGFAVEVMGDESLLEVIELRRLLEPQAAALAARRATAERVAELEASFGAMQAATDEESLVAEDARFHDLVARMSGNGTLASMLQNLASRTLRARVWRSATEAGVGARTVAEHAEILDAIEAGDPALAEATALVHVATTERWFRRVLSGEDGPSSTDTYREVTRSPARRAHPPSATASPPDTPASSEPGTRATGRTEKAPTQSPTSRPGGSRRTSRSTPARSS